MIESIFNVEKIANDVTSYINNNIKFAIKNNTYSNKYIDDIFYTVDSDRQRYASYLCSLFCERSEGEYKKAIPLCGCLELIHAHFLIIDDIADNSLIRRGRKPSYLEFGLSDALFSADILFSVSVEFVNKLVNEMSYDPKLVEVLLSKSRDTNIGQLVDSSFRKRRYVNISEYYDCIDLKIGSLFQLSCLFGTLLGKYTQNTLSTADLFGKYIGRSFQIYDDIVDLFFGTENQDFINADKTFPYSFVITNGSKESVDNIIKIYEDISRYQNVKALKAMALAVFEKEAVVPSALSAIKKNIEVALNSQCQEKVTPDLTNLCNHLVEDYQKKLSKYL